MAHTDSNINNEPVLNYNLGDKMPLAPQITNTPIAIVNGSDFVLTNVANLQENITTFYQTSAPGANAIGDTWFDTDDSNKQYRWDGASWTSVQDGTIAVAYSTAAGAASAASTAQATADGKNKIYRQGTTPTGTFAVGDLWFNTSNDNSISRWDGSSWVANTLGNNALASISANKITAGTIDASVITVSNINAGNISTGTISSIAYNNGSGTFQVTSGGALTATSATITGTINATSGYLGSPSSGWNFSASGFLTNNGGSTILYPTATPGGNASTYSIYTDRGVYAERLFITGTQASAVYSSGGVYAIGGISGGEATFLVNSSGAITATTGITATGAISTSGNISTTGSASITSSGAMVSNGDLSTPNHTTTANAANGYVFSTGGRVTRSTASSRRYKENIVNLSTIPELDPKKLFELPVRAFTYKLNELPETDDRYATMIPGFIAEEVDAIYPIAADYVDGPESWNDRIIVPAMLSLIQDQEARIKALENKGE